jgi:hypothetical protein
MYGLIYTQGRRDGLYSAQRPGLSGRHRQRTVSRGGRGAAGMLAYSRGGAQRRLAGQVHRGQVEGHFSPVRPERKPNGRFLLGR